MSEPIRAVCHDCESVLEAQDWPTLLERCEAHDRECEKRLAARALLAQADHDQTRH